MTSTPDASAPVAGEEGEEAVKLGLGLALALAAALVINIGFFVAAWRHQLDALSFAPAPVPLGPGSGHQPAVDARLRHGIGRVGHLHRALSLAPLSLVQAVAAGGVGVLAFLAHRLGTPLGGASVVGAWIAVAGLLLLGVSLTAHVHRAPAAHTATLLIVIAAGAGAAGLLAGLMARTTRAAVALGCAAGLFFGVGDLATKGAVSGNGLLFVPLLAACTALGFVTLQLAFQRGRVLETAGLSVLVNNMIPIVGGLFLFHEALPGGAAGVARVASFAAVVVGAVLLARAPEAPIEEDGEPQPRTLDGSHAP